MSDSKGRDSFHQVMEGLSAGDQQAARLLYERFIDRLIALAAQRLDRRLGAKVDAESVAMSVFESFFERHRHGELTFHNWGMVLGVLSHITFRKCLNRNRDQRAARRDAAREVTYEDWLAVAKEPGPDQAAMIAEQLQMALAEFDADERAILEAVLAGKGKSVEIAAVEAGFSTRTVFRTLERFRKQLIAMLKSDV